MDSTINDADYLSAPEAAALLGIKRESLYAYASRGLVRSIPGPRGRGRLYLRLDLERLKARHDARAGHGAVAAGALRWGEPILDSAVSSIGGEGPLYRGQPALELVRRGVSFEQAAELLWTGKIPHTPRWEEEAPGYDPRALAKLLPEGSPPIAALSLALPVLALADPARFGGSAEAELQRARRLLRRLAASLALVREPAAVRGALEEASVARLLIHALGARSSDAAAEAIDLALVLSADHELNVSTFAARVAASAGADLYACTTAALATLSGPRHGGACDRVEALVAEAGRPERARDAILARTRRGERPPGFGHRLYPGGDPRTPPLLEAARDLAPRSIAVRTLLALVDELRELHGEAPTVDAGLVAVSAALGLAPGSAVALFAVGRAAGWIAHALEQAATGQVLRPRARYTP